MHAEGVKAAVVFEEGDSVDELAGAVGHVLAHLLNVLFAGLQGKELVGVILLAVLDQFEEVV